MRGVAALAVLCLHLANLFSLSYVPPLAHLSVDFFFLLSGFVIAHAYDPRLRGALSPVEFFKLRVVRLYPMILVGASFGALMLLGRRVVSHDLGLGPGLLAVLSGLLLLPTPVLLAIRPLAFPVNGPFWSLSAEMAVNVIYASVRRLLGPLGLGIAILVSGCALISTAKVMGGLDVGSSWNTAWAGYLRALPTFLIGVALQRMLSTRGPLGRWSFAAPLALGVALLCPWRHAGVWESLISLLIFPALVAVGARAPESRRLDRVWMVLGEISYPLYAIHYPIIVMAANGAKVLKLGGPQVLVLAALVGAGVLVLASLLARRYDLPARRLLRRLIMRRRLGTSVVPE